MLRKADSISLKFFFCTMRRLSTLALHSCTLLTPHTHVHTCSHVTDTDTTCTHSTQALTVLAWAPARWDASYLPVHPTILRAPWKQLVSCLKKSTPLTTYSESETFEHQFECELLKFYFYNTRNLSVLWTLLTTQEIKRRSPFRQ